MRLYSKLFLILFSIFLIGFFLWGQKKPTGQRNPVSSEEKKVAQSQSGHAQPVKMDIDAAKDGPLYGDMEGLLRIQNLEKQLAQFKIREDHPRIFINRENLADIRKKIGPHNAYWQKILERAERGDLISAAFSYAVLEGVNPQAGQLALDIAKK